MKLITKVFFLTALFTGLFSCTNSTEKRIKNKEVKKDKQQHTLINSPEFNADSAFYYIRKQIEFGPRNPNSEGHKNCAEWLVNKLKEHTPNVEIQHFKSRAFDGKIYKGKNIIASFNPEINKRIMLSAHYDTRPFSDQEKDKNLHNKPIDGANDGGSGVGVLLELARNFKQLPPTVGVDIFFWDLEDYGMPAWKNGKGDGGWCLGSKYWSENPHKINYSANYGILLDMVGGKNNVFAVEGYSLNYAQNIAEKIWNTAAEMGYSHIFVPYKGMTVTDDHVPINQIAKIPTIDILGSSTAKGYYNFDINWHTQKDNLENININLLETTGKVVSRVVYSEK
ncbi:MAG: M28 family peptidase [Bacteroidales bacterium]